VHPLEERIGYKFRNPLLLAEALTHPSLGHETQQRHFDNQRLEFLGDAILQLVITEYLFGHFGDQPEGQLTKLRSRLVSRDALKTHAAALDLGQFLLMGRGEEASGGRARVSTLADGFEALIGAIFVDGGFSAARETIRRLYEPLLAALDPTELGKDPKTLLQELLQARRIALPQYSVVATHGAAHSQNFEVECLIPQLSVRTQGSGSTRRNAEQEAALRAYEQIRRRAAVP